MFFEKKIKVDLQELNLPACRETWKRDKQIGLFAEYTLRVHEVYMKHTLSILDVYNTWCGINQKQPPRGVPRKRCSENMQQIYKRTAMPKCDFNEVPLQLY